MAACASASVYGGGRPDTAVTTTLTVAERLEVAVMRSEDPAAGSLAAAGPLSFTITRRDDAAHAVFIVKGLTQGFLLGERWDLDLHVDASDAYEDSGPAPPVVNPDLPFAPGATGAAGENYLALSGGLAYRADRWSWNARAERREGELGERLGFTTGLLRLAQSGVAFAAAAQALRADEGTGAHGVSGTLGLSWAVRPLGRRFSVLDRLELRYDEVSDGAGTPGPLGEPAVTGNARSRRIVNTLNVQRVAQPWRGADRQGNLFAASQRGQWSLYYGAKYIFDGFGAEDPTGYAQLLGTELRHDLTPWLDVGFQASALHARDAAAMRWSASPLVGLSPVANGELTLGWNVRGFDDPDFDATRHTAQGPFLKLRFEFDPSTPFRAGHPDPRALRSPASS